MTEDFTIKTYTLGRIYGKNIKVLVVARWRLSREKMWKFSNSRHCATHARA